MAQDLADGRYVVRPKTMVRLGALCGLVVLLTIIVCSMREKSRLNFGVVAPGVLMRSAQPTGEDLEAIRKEYGLKTIVSLRSGHRMEKDPTCLAEVAFAKEHGMAFVSLSIHTPPAREKIETFLKIVDDPVNHPVLVHCAEGQIRASMMCAAYGMERLGWSNEMALAEQVPFRFERSGRNKEQAREFILGYRAANPLCEVTESP